ncbi:MAG: PEP-CTERM sorting domain-containing protein [Akkermansia muciniphila]
MTETIRGGALTACAAAVAFGQIAHADAKPNLTDEVGRAEAARIVELSIKQQVLDQLQKTYGHSFENLEMELLEQRSLDPQNMLRFLLSADGLDSCLLLVMLDAESGAVLDVRPEGKLATTDDMVRNKYATVLRNLTTGQTMALRAGDFVPTVGPGGSSSANREGGGSKLGPWPYFPWVAEPRHQSETSADSDSAGSDTPQYTVPLVPAGSSAPVVAASAPASVVIASSPAASAPSAPGSGAVSCGGGAACGGGGGAGGSSGGGSASASPAPAAPAAPEEPSDDPSQPSDPTDSEDEDNGDMDKSDSTDPGSEDASLTLPEDSAATPAAASVPARARLFSLPVKMLGATAATYAASEESGVSATADTETPTEWKYGWNSENKCVTLNSKDVIYERGPVSLVTPKDTYNIKPDGNGNYVNTVFSLDANPKLIQAVYDTGKVNSNAHVSIKLIANSSDSRADSSLRTDFKGIDTVHLVSNADGSSRSLCMSGASSFLKNEESSLYVNGWHLWLNGTGDMNYAVDVAATLYLGGCNYNIQWATERGVNCDIRAQGLVRFNNTINLIDDASIVGVFSKSESDANSYGVIFTSSSRVNGNGYDLSFAGKGASMSNFVSSPFTMEAGSELSDVKSLIIGRLTSVAPTTLNIEAASGDQAAARIKAGSLRVGQGSTVNVSAGGASHMYFSGKESVADYDAGMADYSLLLVKDSSKGSAVINLADKASLSCNTNNLTHKDGSVIGRVTGAFAVDVASDGTVSISGGTAAEKETVGKAWDTCSVMENLKLDIKAGASLVLNDIILGNRHALRGEEAANPGSLKLNNVVIGLVPDNYTTQSVATLAEGGSSLDLKATGGGARTLTIDDEASILSVYYTGMENLVFEDGSTLVLDFANMELELGDHKYVKIVFDESVKFDPEKVTITSVSGSLDSTGYYLPTAEGGGTNVVYFLAPEPASAVLCLFGLAAGAARRRRKQK